MFDNKNNIALHSTKHRVLSVCDTKCKHYGNRYVVIVKVAHGSGSASQSNLSVRGELLFIIPSVFFFCTSYEESRNA